MPEQTCLYSCLKCLCPCFFPPEAHTKKMQEPPKNDITMNNLNLTMTAPQPGSSNNISQGKNEQQSKTVMPTTQNQNSNKRPTSLPPIGITEPKQYDSNKTNATTNYNSNNKNNTPTSYFINPIEDSSIKPAEKSFSVYSPTPDKIHRKDKPIQNPAPKSPSKYTITAFFNEISSTYQTSQKDETAKISAFLSPLDQTISKSFKRYSYFNENNEKFTIIEFQNREFTYFQIKNQTIADFMSEFKQQNQDKVIKFKISKKPRTYSFEFHVFQSAKNYFIDKVEDDKTWEYVLNNFRGNQDYFNQKDEVTQDKIIVCFKGKNAIYSRIKDMLVRQISDEVQLVSLEEDSNAMNTIRTSFNAIGAGEDEWNEQDQREDEQRLLR